MARWVAWLERVGALGRAVASEVRTSVMRTRVVRGVSRSVSRVRASVTREMGFRDIRKLMAAAEPVVFDPRLAFICGDCEQGTYAPHRVSKCAACGSDQITPIRTVHQVKDGPLCGVSEVLLQRGRKPAAGPMSLVR